jgi:hypothetical protein
MGNFIIVGQQFKKIWIFYLKKFTLSFTGTDLKMYNVFLTILAFFKISTTKNNETTNLKISLTILVKLKML